MGPTSCEREEAYTRNRMYFLPLYLIKQLVENMTWPHCIYDSCCSTRLVCTCGQSLTFLTWFVMDSDPLYLIKKLVENMTWPHYIYDSCCSTRLVCTCVQSLTFLTWFVTDSDPLNFIKYSIK